MILHVEIHVKMIESVDKLKHLSNNVADHCAIKILFILSCGNT